MSDPDPGQYGKLYHCLDRDGALIYIGSTTDLAQRMRVHRRNTVFYDRISVVEDMGWLPLPIARRIEVAAIEHRRPPLNREFNPDYARMPRKEQAEKFRTALALVPVTDSPHIVVDGRSPQEKVDALRRAHEHLRRAWDSPEGRLITAVLRARGFPRTEADTPAA